MPKIYGTLGPSCWEVETLCEMFDAGMTGVRLNLSHITLHDAAQEIENLHRAAGRCGISADLLIDMQGPELRIGALEAPITLEEGQEVTLGAGGIPVPALTLPCFTPGQELLLDDGKLLLTVLDGSKHRAQAKIVRGGVLSSRKSLALPGCSLHPPTLTEMDTENLSLAVSYGVTGVMQPFVRDRADLETVRSVLDRYGGKSIRLFAKIENQEGVRNLDELLPFCDEIVIARGDLGNAMPLWELPHVQKMISRKCRDAGRDFMVVTQMLYTMEHSPVPTRAEVSDIFNAVCDGAASVMVTGETAVGDYPVESIRYLTKTAEEAAQFLKNTQTIV